MDREVRRPAVDAMVLAELSSGEMTMVDVIDYSARGACVLAHPEVRVREGEPFTVNSVPATVRWVKETSLATVVGLEFAAE